MAIDHHERRFDNTRVAQSCREIRPATLLIGCLWKARFATTIMAKPSAHNHARDGTVPLQESRTRVREPLAVRDQCGCIFEQRNEIDRPECRHALKNPRPWRGSIVLINQREAASRAIGDPWLYERSLSERMAMVDRARLARGRVQRLLDADAPIQVLEEAASQAPTPMPPRRRLRAMMLYRVSRVLNPEQRARLAALARERARGTAP